MTGELGTDGALDNLGQIFVIFKVNVDTDFVGKLDDFIKCPEVGVDNDRGVDVLLKEPFDSCQDLTSEDNDGGGTITDFFVLGSGQLDHTLGCWMLDINFSQDSVAIIGQDNTTHGVKEHLKHALWSESSSNDIGDSLSSLDVGSLSFLTLLSFGVWVQNVDGSLTHIFKF